MTSLRAGGFELFSYWAPQTFSDMEMGLYIFPLLPQDKAFRVEWSKKSNYMTATILLTFILQHHRNLFVVCAYQLITVILDSTT